MEELIHRELPAHILARVCWVGYIHGVVDDPDNDMRNLQEKWKAFLGQKKEPPDYTASMECTKELFNVMNQLNNIYPKGTLHDCENETTEENKNKIILNRTALGTL